MSVQGVLHGGTLALSGLLKPSLSQGTVFRLGEPSCQQAPHAYAGRQPLPCTWACTQAVAVAVAGPANNSQQAINKRLHSMAARGLGLQWLSSGLQPDWRRPVELKQVSLHAWPRST